MTTIVLVIHLMVCLALIAVVLLQRSEGGALGIGGGGGGGMMAGRGPASMLTRLTSILAGVFFLTSIALTILAGQPSGGGGSILDRIDRGAPASGGTTLPSGPTSGGILDKITPPGAPTAPTPPSE